MKHHHKTFKVIIPKPCSEDWQKMEARDSGKFCSNCQKVVVDFSSLTDKELYQYISAIKSIPCGRFHSSQLSKNISITEPQRKPWTTIYKRFAAIIAFLSLKPGGFFAQTNAETSIQPVTKKNTSDTLGHAVISGVVRNSENVAVEGAEIKFDEKPVAVSDKDGRFEFTIASTNKSSLITITYPGLIRVARSYHSTMQSTSYNVVLAKPLELHRFVMGAPVYNYAFEPFTLTFGVGQLTSEKRAKLADIGASLRNVPDAEVQLMAYATTPKEIQKAKESLKAVKSYFVEREGISEARIHVKVKAKRYGKIDTVDILPKQPNEEIQ